MYLPILDMELFFHSFSYELLYVSYRASLDNSHFF